MSNTLKQLKRAKEIVDRYLACGCVFPRELRDCGRSDPVRQQEYRDACKIKTWKYSLLGKNRYTCSDEVRDYMDENMPGWRDRVYSHKGHSSSIQMAKASEIVRRYRERGCARPRRLNDPNREQEYKDAVNLSTWKSALKGHNRVTCSPELRDYLDENIPGWREDYNTRGNGGNRKSAVPTATNAAFDAKTTIDTTIDGNESKNISTVSGEQSIPSSTAASNETAGETAATFSPPHGRRAPPPPSTEALMPVAEAIVLRYQQRGNVLPSLKAECRMDPTRAQEYKDAGRLHSWKIQTMDKLTPEVLDYLNSNMPGWKKRTVSKAKTSSGTRVGEAGEQQEHSVSPPSRQKHKQKHSPLQLQLLKAREVVQRCILRQKSSQGQGHETFSLGQSYLPRHLPGRQETPHLILEQKDAIKLSDWKRASLASSLPQEVKAYLDKDLPGWMNIDSESPVTFAPSALVFPSSSSSYNNTTATRSTNCYTCPSTNLSSYNNSFPVGLAAATAGEYATHFETYHPLVRKKGTHIRAKPTRRKKVPILSTSLSAKEPAIFKRIASSASDSDSITSENNRENHQHYQCKSDSDEELGVAALLQLSSSNSPRDSVDSGECHSPHSHSGGGGSSYGSQSPSTGYYSNDHDSDSDSVTRNMSLSQHEGGGFKRLHSFVEAGLWGRQLETVAEKRFRSALEVSSPLCSTGINAISGAISDSKTDANIGINTN